MKVSRMLKFLRKATPSDARRVVENYPPSSFIKTEKGYFYVFSVSKRYRIISDRILSSWSPQRIIETSESDPAVMKLRVSSKLKFRNGSLIYLHQTGSIYLIVGSKKCRISNPIVLENLGAKPSDAIWVTPEEANLHEDGEQIV